MSKYHFEDGVTLEHVRTEVIHRMSNNIDDIEQKHRVLTGRVTNAENEITALKDAELTLTADSIERLIDDTASNVSAHVAGGKVVLTATGVGEGGGPALSAAALKDLINNDQGNVDATVSAGKIYLQATGVGGEQGPPGVNGTNGTDGADGADGVGVPVGGTTGQILAKSTDADHETHWIDAPTGGEGGGACHVPAGGTAGQYLAKASNDDHDAEWVVPVMPPMTGLNVTYNMSLATMPSTSSTVSQEEIAKVNAISAYTSSTVAVNYMLPGIAHPGEVPTATQYAHGTLIYISSPDKGTFTFKLPTLAGYGFVYHGAATAEDFVLPPRKFVQFVTMGNPDGAYWYVMVGYGDLPNKPEAV